MRITRACDYTLRALMHMGKFPEGSVFMRSDLATIISVPNSFLGKILQNLAKSGILISERGKKGGFRLGRVPKEISIYDIFIAVDGPLNINNCMDKNFECEAGCDCQATHMWQDIQNNLEAKLKTYSLADISKEGFCAIK